MTIEQAREVVATGVDFLDSHPLVPDNWRTLIDVSTLDMSDGYRCILGQLASHLDGVTVEEYQEPYHVACHHLWPEETDWSIDSSPAIRFGFYPQGRLLFAPSKGASDLDQAWTEVLAPADTAAA